MLTLSKNGQKVFNARYAMKDDQGNIIENFEQAVTRLAKTATLAEKEELREEWELKFVDVIGNLLFVPSTPIWANMGKPDRIWQPGACFVLDVEDSLDGMYQTLKETALVFKSGGGVGYNFSKIRPKGDLVRSTKGQASGVVELIKLYDSSSNMVVQGGVRRGASMGILNIDHPEVIDFIKSKLNGTITNFNLSVGITYKFMESLKKGEDWELTFNGRVYKTLPAKELWDLICQSAHACGDPGIIFLDRLRETNPAPSIPINATNPCGEVALSPGESCLLGSINLAKIVDKNGVNWELLKDVVAVGVRYLDNMIDVAQYPLEIISQNTRRTRKIGLGCTGLADALIMSGLAYDSEEGRRFAGNIASFIQTTAHEVSIQLANEKGNFPAWEESVYAPDTPHRNAALICLAPTGSVTAMAGCEGYGIEPIFAVAYQKETLAAGTFDVFSPLFLEACKEYDVPESILSEVAKKGSCQGVRGIPEDIQRVFKGAQEISPKDHLLMQAELQKYVDNAISKTCNLPNSATVEDISNIYRTAHELKLKGITVFRDGCKQGVITVGEKKQEEPKTGELKRGEIRPRPESALGQTTALYTGCGKIYLTLNYDQETGEVLEVFISTGGDGGCRAYTEATSRLISLAIRGGIPVTEIADQLKSVHPCPSYMVARSKNKNGNGKAISPGSSCSSAIGRKLLEIAQKINGHTEEKEEKRTDWTCPECGENLFRAEGCMVCQSCGYSKC